LTGVGLSGGPMPSSVRSNIHKLTSHLRSERGIALPAALMMLLVISALSAVAATAATSGADQSVKDKSAKRALAGSDAGLQAALYRTNKVPHASDKCVTKDTTGVLVVTDPDANGWCPVQTEELGDGASFTYRVSTGSNVTQNGQSLVERTIVATGCVLPGTTPDGCLASTAGVKRRAKTAVASLNAALFGAGGVLSKETLVVENNGYIGSSVASNDSVVIQNNAEICGNVTYGPGANDAFTMQNNAVYDCAGTSARKAQQEFLMNPIQGDGARTTNDNSNFFATDTMTGTATWDAANRILRINNNSSVTLTGDTYSFCYLEVENNAQLIIAPRAPARPPLRIFIDKPENCAGAGPDKGNIRVENNAAIVNQTDDVAMLQLYVEGSTSTATNVLFRNNSGGPDTKLVVYAPNSTVTVENNGNFRGAIAAKRVTVANNGSLVWDARAAAVTMSTDSVYQRRSWTECTVTPQGGAPDSGC
jgi:hypothetical protein